MHFGHLRIALEVSQHCYIQPIKFLPCRQQVLKSHAPVDAMHRLAMLQLAVAGEAAFEVDERELQRATPSYMYDTLVSLQSDYPGHPLCLILGSDTVKNFEQWYNWQAIFTLAHLIVITRPSYDVHRVSWLQQALATSQIFDPNELKQAIAGKIFMLTTSLLDISAEGIRRQLASQRSPRFLLPDSVLNYIHQHHLYEG